MYCLGVHLSFRRRKIWENNPSTEKANIWNFKKSFKDRKVSKRNNKGRTIIGKKIVLLVDDEPGVHKTLDSALARYGEGIRIENAMSEKKGGIKKYEELKARGMKPHLVLMDIKMPSMNGIEATKSILRIDGNAHVFAFSAFDDDGYDVEVKKSGAQGFIKKSESIKEIVKKIKKELDNI